MAAFLRKHNSYCLFHAEFLVQPMEGDFHAYFLAYIINTNKHTAPSILEGFGIYCIILRTRNVLKLFKLSKNIFLLHFFSVLQFYRSSVSNKKNRELNHISNKFRTQILQKLSLRMHARVVP